MSPPQLEQWAPDPAVGTVSRREAAAETEPLWRAASTVRLAECRLLGPLVRWRIPGLEQPLTYQELLRQPPFTLLAEGDGYSLSGLVGRIWTLRRDYGELRDAEDFLAWDEPGTVRVLLATWAQPAGAGHSALVSEVRVVAVDDDAERRLGTLRALIRGSQWLIGREPLQIAARRAERGK